MPISNPLYKTFQAVLISFSFSLSFVPFVEAQTSDPAVLPVVSLATFAVGNSWTWDYLEPSGNIYSTERYTVLATRDSVVLIEMASDYAGGQNFKANHRIQVDISQCLGAYKNPVQKKPWKFQMFYLNQGQWTGMEQRNTLAFEEKFNCNAHRYSKPSAPYLTAFDVLDGRPVFSQKLWRKLEASWFPISGNLAAIAVFKNFSSGTNGVYKMKLRAQELP